MLWRLPDGGKEGRKDGHGSWRHMAATRAHPPWRTDQYNTDQVSPVTTWHIRPHHQQPTSGCHHEAESAIGSKLSLPRLDTLYAKTYQWSSEQRKARKDRLFITPDVLYFVDFIAGSLVPIIMMTFQSTLVVDTLNFSEWLMTSLQIPEQVNQQEFCVSIMTLTRAIN